MKQGELDILKAYLSEEEIKEIVIEEYRKTIRIEIAEVALKNKTSAVTNYERVISNAIFYYLENNIDALLETNTKQLIKDNVLKTIKKVDYNYNLFRVASAWEKEDSIAQKIVTNTLLSQKSFIEEQVKDKLKTNLENISYDDLSETINEVISNLIDQKLKA